MSINPISSWLSDLHLTDHIMSHPFQFQKIFVLNFRDRPDKLDGFSSAAAATDITAETMPAIRGQDIADDTLPSTDGLPTKEGQRDDAVGSWRSHLNFVREVVNRRLATALMLEDDADWDVSLKEQLHLVAQGSQYIFGSGVTKPRGQPWSPYGDDWDLLWLGHCGSTIKPNDARRFIVEKDPTVPAPGRRVNQPMRNLVNMKEQGFDNTTRVLYQTDGGRCTHAYALSQRGARRTLATLSSLRRFEPFDVALSRICREEARFKCLSVFPQLVGGYEKLISNDRDEASLSSSSSTKKGHDLALLGWGTPNIVYSTRLNMARLLAGNKENFERQWPDDPEIKGPAQTRTLNRGP